MHASRMRSAQKAAPGRGRVALTVLIVLAVQIPPPCLDAATAAPARPAVQQLVARLRGGVDAAALAGGPWGGSAEARGAPAAGGPPHCGALGGVGNASAAGHIVMGSAASAVGGRAGAGAGCFPDAQCTVPSLTEQGSRVRHRTRVGTLLTDRQEFRSSLTVVSGFGCHITLRQACGRRGKHLEKSSISISLACCCRWS